MLDRFLATKLYLPHPRPGTVARPRLVARLDALPPAGIALLAAPAGFGKTVAAVQWLNRSRETAAVAWLALDAADNDAGRFWSALVAALDAAAPALASEAAALVRARGPLDTDALLAVLIEALAASPVPVILALDHLNAVHEPAVLDALAVLLENLPEAARAILTTRVRPALPTPRWLLDGRLAELTEAELRFSREEARDFFEAQDLPADEDAIARLTDTTEGWIAGLVLAARAARDRGLGAVLASFDGAHRYVGDYLAAEALDTQSEATRSFLIATAVLDRLSGPLCDAVTEREAGTSQSILESLDAENVFVVPLDDARQWFRYHRLFADVLRTRLASERSASDVRDLHRRAAQWYRDHDFIARAVGHSLEAGDEAESADFILSAADASWTLGRAATLLSWIRALPADAIERHPRLGVYTALALVLMGQSLEIVDPTLDAIAIALADDTPDWRGRMAVVRGIGAGVRGLSDVAAAQSREAMRLLDDDNLPWRGLATIDLGLAELARGDLGAAARAFSEARVLGIRAANPYATLAASVNLARANHADGALHAAAAAYREALACADEHTLHQLPLTGLAHVGLGDVLREWNMCPEAAERIDAGLRLAEGRHVHVRVAVAGHLARARLRLAQGRRAEVESDIDAAEALAMRYDRVEYLADVHYVRALVALQAGDPGPALRWAAADGRRAANGTPSDAAAVEPTAAFAMLARLALFEGEADAAERHIAQLAEALGEKGGRLAERIDLELLRARLAFARGETDRAAAEMRRALALAQPEGYVRAVLDEGPAAAALLALVANSGPAPDASGDVAAGYAADLAAALGSAAGLGAPTSPGVDDAQRRPGGPAPTPSAVEANAALLEPLSARELEVLAAVAEGATNQEIADRLYVALSTVKTHMNNVFGKLGVRSRTQAVARARAIGLL